MVTHKDLTARAQKQVPTAQHLSLNNFLDGVFYDGLVAKLTANSTDKAIPVEVVPQVATERGGLNVTEDQIFLNLTARTKEEAIQFAGEQLVKLGFAEADYVPAMFEREQQVSTYLGEGIAVPHGTIAAKDKVLKPVSYSANIVKACVLLTKKMVWRN
ncbi:PTS system mannitol-specific EIICBA component [Actinobacillus equuli]|nr:PTS system mannitol-specific EIICBA component [Actinobacillus equuli]